MNYTIFVKPEAELDILKTAQWYEQKQYDLGSRFLDEIEEKLNLIKSNPLHYQVRYKTTRLALVEHFPCAIHFNIEKDKVIVLAVLGTREDSEKWK
ncbi:type II toxin-antitoxin system RelE/ParE family toxin [Fulvivirga sp.]|uniref:type II toxin-antitoxin system RelE/ParE family toxin n=1 Tax=Fulvivirga sp. TaxID=1931237 RepID=UPI0032EEA41E